MSQIKENINALLMKCAEFYSDESNYEKKLVDKQSQIDLDKGFVAKETLKTVKILMEQEEKFDQLATQLEEEGSPEDLLKQIEEITKKYGR